MYIRAALILIFIIGSALADEQLAAAIKKYESDHPGVMHIRGDVSQPELTYKVEAEFPDSTKKKKRIFTAIFAAIVVENAGAVKDPTIVRSDHPDLDPFVIEALKKWKYKPARKNGEPVEVFLIITVLIHPR
jgi:periplasmic protein TonB